MSLRTLAALAIAFALIACQAPPQPPPNSSDAFAVVDLAFET